MNKKKILTIALLVSLPFLLTACSLKDLPVVGKYLPDWPGGGGGTGTSVPSSEVTLNVWGIWENSEVIDALVKKYQEKHPNVKVQYEDRTILKPTDYKESVYTRLTQQGSTASDVVFVHNSWVSLIKDNLDPVPSQVATPEGFSKKYYPSAASSAIFNGNVYAMPLYYDGLVLVYNKNHFRDVNQEQPPVSWEEFRRLALDLTVRSNDSLVRGGAAIGTFKNIDFSPDIIGLMFAQAGLNMPADLDMKSAYDAVTFYTNFAKVDQVWDDTFPEASVAFSQEKASMIFVPAWNLLDILQARPDWDRDGVVGVAPVPQAYPNPEEYSHWGSFWMAAVPAKSANKDTAWDFVNFITQDEQAKLWFEEASRFRPFGPAYASRTIKGDLSGNSYLAPLLESAEKSKTGIFTSRSGNKTSVEAIGTAINAVLYSGQSSESALKAVKEAIVTPK